ncbi:MAG: amidohydrolase family protein [Planctomycetota bacterium]|nr:amidohydrolase family protein [Planctomycetota bacterium]
MIVDVHTHLWDSLEQLGPGSAQRVRQRQDAPWARPDGSALAHELATQPVSYAFVLGLDSRAIGAAIPAASVAQWVSRRPDKLLGFAGVDPTAPDAPAQVDAVRKLKLAGIVISPATQDVPAGDPRTMRVLERCEALGLPVLVHPDTHLQRGQSIELLSPLPFDAILRALPRLRVVLAQVGDPWTDLTLAMLDRHEHLYADLSELASRPGQLRQVLLAAEERGVANKLFMGSDFPFHTPEQAIAALYATHTGGRGAGLPAIARETIHGIVRRDVLTCLGIPVPPPAPGIPPGILPGSSPGTSPEAAPAGKGNDAGVHA